MGGQWDSGAVAGSNQADRDFSWARELFDQFDGNLYYMALDGPLEMLATGRCSTSRNLEKPFTPSGYTATADTSPW